VGTFVINVDRGLYRLYVAHPPSGQILRYEPVADGSSFIAPTPYFLGENEPVATFRELFIDGDIYALTGDNALRYYNGKKVTSYAFEIPPDDADVRPDHDYQRFAGTGARNADGRLYVWDARHSRVLVFNKDDGAYEEQFVAATGSTAFADVRGMYVDEGLAGDAPVLYFVTASGLYRATLLAPAEAEPTPTPGSSVVSPTEEPTSSPVVLPTDRPRRTPRPSPSPTP